MFEWSHTVVSDAAPQKVWPLYAEVDRWLEWDSGLEAVSLDGPFDVGSSGLLHVEGQPPLTWTLTVVVEGSRFDDVTEIPGVATLRFGHLIEADGAGSRITHTVTIEGPAAGQLGPMVVSDTPEAMERLAALASAA
jgi:hypothetical protein